MKKQLLKLSAVFAGLFLFGMVAKAQHEQPIRTMVIPYVTDAINLDGQDAEASWSAEEDLTVYWNPVPPIPLKTSDLSGYMKTCYDDNKIYVFAHVVDDTACDYAGGSNQWEYDNVELFFDLDTTINLVSNLGSYNQNADASSADATQLRYNRGCDTTTGNAPRNSQDLNNFALAENSTSWNLEVAVPFLAWMPEGNTIADLNAWLDKALGFDVSFADSDKVPAASGARTGQMAWDDDVTATSSKHADCDNAWHDTRAFGIVTLGAKPNAIKNINNTNISMYPVPASSILNINNISDAKEIVMFNTLGQAVKTISSIDAASVVVPVSDLAKGAYIVRITLNNGDVVSENIMIN